MREDEASEDRSHAPHRKQQAIAAVAGVQSRLRIRNLDRAGGGEEDQGHRIHE